MDKKDKKTIEELSKDDIELYYINSPPKKWTFQPPKIKNMVEAEIEGLVLNLFAGKTKLDHDGEIIRVDQDEEKDADYNMSALDFLAQDDREYDTVVLDPPYNVRKSREKYEDGYMGNFTRIKNKVKDKISPSGKVITFGYATTGMAKTRGFKKHRAYIINHKGDHNDTLCIVERKD